MCVERIQRFITALVVLTAAILLMNGYQFGFYMLWFVSGMLMIWGISNFCPSLSILRKIGVKPCEFKK
jgi:hypothetical protein